MTLLTSTRYRQRPRIAVVAFLLGLKPPPPSRESLMVELVTIVAFRVPGEPS